MSFDASKVGIAAAQLMEDLETDQAEVGDRQEIGDVMLLAEVRGEDGDGPYTYIRYRGTDERVWVQRGLLHAALEQDAQQSALTKTRRTEGARACEADRGEASRQ